MALGRWQATIVDAQGNVVPGASVTVRREVGGAPLEPLYSDREGTVSAGNPIAADAEGFVAFHCAGGAFRIDASKAGFSRTWRYVAIGTAAERDAGAMWTPRGAWDDGESYSIGDAVEHGGYLFVSLEDANENNEPDDSPASDEHWMLAGQIPVLPENTVVSTDVTSIVALTQAEYDALDPADPDTLYVIREEEP